MGFSILGDQVSPQVRRYVISLLSTTPENISQAFAGQVLEKVERLVISDVSLDYSCKIFMQNSFQTQPFLEKEKQKNQKRCPDRAGVSIISQPDNQKTLFDSSSSTVDPASDSKTLIVYLNFNFADKTVITNNISFL